MITIFWPRLLSLEIVELARPISSLNIVRELLKIVTWPLSGWTLNSKQCSLMVVRLNYKYGILLVNNDFETLLKHILKVPAESF